VNGLDAVEVATDLTWNPREGSHRPNSE